MKKITANSVVVKIVRCLSVCVASVYLTFLVDISTLNTALKRVFVFIYFVIMCALFLYLKKRFLKSANSSVTLVISVAAASLILIVFQNTFLPTARSNSIALQAGEVGEVWFTDIEVDGKSIPFSQLEITENHSWVYSADYDDYVFYPNENWAANSLIFDIVGNEIVLNFGANTWSGSVHVTEFEKGQTILDLYSEDTECDKVSFLIDASWTYSLWERCIYNVGAMLLLSFLLSALLNIVNLVSGSREAVGLSSANFLSRFFSSPELDKGEEMRRKETGAKKREPALDIVRIVALFYVVSVHFFLNSEYYSYPVLGYKMFVSTTMRTAFMSCVPLFCVLSGYLTGEKALSAGYYRGILKILRIYVLACLANILWKHAFFSMEVSFRDCIEGILNFSAAPYGWYVEMYIGLFLLTPFFNILYNNLPSTAHKKALILTLIFLTALPEITNIFNFRISGWWLNPTLSSDYQKILPSWWGGIWPMTYFFLGRYINEQSIRVKPVRILGLYVGSVFIFGAFNYYRSYGLPFVSGPWQGWGALPNVIMTILLFVLLVSAFNEIESLRIKKILSRLSNLCFGGYLVSYIFDTAFYPILNRNISNVENRIYFYPFISVLVFSCSLLLSYFLQKILQFADVIKRHVRISHIRPL